MQNMDPKRDQNPVVKQEPTRHKISVFGTVNNQDGRFVYTINPIFNVDTFLEHLKELIQFRTKKKKILLVVDNARYHHAILLKPWLEPTLVAAESRIQIKNENKIIPAGPLRMNLESVRIPVKCCKGYVVR